MGQLRAILRRQDQQAPDSQFKPGSQDWGIRTLPADPGVGLDAQELVTGLGEPAP